MTNINQLFKNNINSYYLIPIVIITSCMSLHLMMTNILLIPKLMILKFLGAWTYFFLQVGIVNLIDIKIIRNYLNRSLVVSSYGVLSMMVGLVIQSTIEAFRNRYIMYNYEQYIQFFAITSFIMIMSTLISEFVLKTNTSINLIDYVIKEFRLLIPSIIFVNLFYTVENNIAQIIVMSITILRIAYILSDYMKIIKHNEIYKHNITHIMHLVILVCFSIQLTLTNSLEILFRQY